MSFIRIISDGCVCDREQSLCYTVPSKLQDYHDSKDLNDYGRSQPHCSLPLIDRDSLLVYLTNTNFPQCVIVWLIVLSFVIVSAGIAGLSHIIDLDFDETGSQPLY